MQFENARLTAVSSRLLIGEFKSKHEVPYDEARVCLRPDTGIFKTRHEEFQTKHDPSLLNEPLAAAQFRVTGKSDHGLAACAFALRV